MSSALAEGFLRRAIQNALRTSLHSIKVVARLLNTRYWTFLLDGGHLDTTSRILDTDPGQRVQFLDTRSWTPCPTLGHASWTRILDTDLGHRSWTPILGHSVQNFGHLDTDSWAHWKERHRDTLPFHCGTLRPLRLYCMCHRIHPLARASLYDSTRLPLSIGNKRP